MQRHVTGYSVIYYCHNFVKKILTMRKLFGIIHQYDIVQMYLNKIHTPSDFCGVAYGFRTKLTAVEEKFKKQGG